MVDSSSPRYGEKASYYSAVCLETGEVEWMELEGNSNSETSAVFLRQLRERRLGPLNVSLGQCSSVTVARAVREPPDCSKATRPWDLPVPKAVNHMPMVWDSPDFKCR